MSRPPPPPSVPQLQLVVLGVGAGATHVYHGQCSSSFLLMAGDSPLLLIDSGYGAVHAARRHTGGRLPTHVYISHNHSDHAGELPVLLAVQAAAGSRMTVLAERQVMQRLQQHRLAELQSTGQPLEYFADFQAMEAGRPHLVAGGVELTLHPAVHAETCYGFLLAHYGQALLGFTADSGFSLELYDFISPAPTLLVDARRQQGSEHASFASISHAAQEGAFRDCLVYIHGYGRLDEAASPSELPGCASCAVPGQAIELQPRGAKQQQHEGEGSSLSVPATTL